VTMYNYYYYSITITITEHQFLYTS